MNIVYVPIFFICLLMFLILVAVLVQKRTKNGLLTFSAIWFAWGIVVVPYLIISS